MRGFPCLLLLCLAACGAGENLDATHPGYRSDPRTGCKVWFDYPWKGETASWSGPCVGGYAEGRGTAEGHIGDTIPHRYVGEMRRGKPHGWGRRYAMIADGSVEGQWQDGKQEGWLIAYDRDDDVSYQGEGRDSQPYGWGKDGQYEGYHRETGRHGYGVLRLKEGRYEGLFADGYPDGQGTFTTAKGALYSGAWSRGCYRQGSRWATVAKRPVDCGFEWQPAPGQENRRTVASAG